MNIIWILLNLLLGVFCLGFLFHTSSGTDLIFNKYSSNYTFFLLFILTFWFITAWLGFQKSQQLKAFLSSTSLVLLMTSVLALLTLPGAYIYFHHLSLQRDIFSPVKEDSHAFFQIEQAPDFPKNLSTDTIKILTLGGSTTYGVGLKREETYPSVLEQLLRSKFPDRKIKVVNAGVPWHTSMHSLLRYVGHYSDWKPDVVIVLHAFNDIFQSSEGQLTSGQFQSDYGHFFGALGNRVIPKDRFSTNISSFINRNWLARTWYSDFKIIKNIPVKKPVNLLTPLATFSRNLAEIIRRANQDGALTILTTQPYLYKDQMSKIEKDQLFYDFYYKDYAIVPTIKQQKGAVDAFNDTAKKIAFQSGTTLVDLESAIPKSTEYLFDDVHYTKKGAQLVAQQVYKHPIWNQLLN